MGVFPTSSRRSSASSHLFCLQFVGYAILQTMYGCVSLVCIDTYPFAHQGMSPSDLLRHLLESLDYENYLKKTQPDWESRWDNVHELINFASEVESISMSEVDEVHSDAEWDTLGQLDRKQLGITELGVRSIVKGKGKAKQMYVFSACRMRKTFST